MTGMRMRSLGYKVLRIDLFKESYALALVAGWKENDSKADGQMDSQSLPRLTHKQKHGEFTAWNSQILAKNQRARHTST